MNKLSENLRLGVPRNDPVIRWLNIFALVFLFALPVAHMTPGCSTPPNQRVVAVQTLKAVGQSAESAMLVVANLYNAKRITVEQAQKAIDLYDTRFQPAFRIAVAAANANLDSSASAELVQLLTELSQYVATLAQQKT